MVQSLAFQSTMLAHVMKLFDQVPPDPIAIAAAEEQIAYEIPEKDSGSKIVQPYTSHHEAIATLMKLSVRLLKEGGTTSERFLFYLFARHKLVNKPPQCKAVIRDVCSMFQCDRVELGIVTTSSGQIFGAIGFSSYFNGSALNLPGLPGHPICISDQLLEYSPQFKYYLENGAAGHEEKPGIHSIYIFESVAMMMKMMQFLPHEGTIGFGLSGHADHVTLALMAKIIKLIPAPVLGQVAIGFCGDPSIYSVRIASTVQEALSAALGPQVQVCVRWLLNTSLLKQLQSGGVFDRCTRANDNTTVSRYCNSKFAGQLGDLVYTRGDEYMTLALNFVFGVPACCGHLISVAYTLVHHVPLKLEAEGIYEDMEDACAGSFVLHLQEQMGLSLGEQQEPVSLAIKSGLCQLYRHQEARKALRLTEIGRLQDEADESSASSKRKK
jgi:hypothetical protein